MNSILTIEEGLKTLELGGVIAYPTETFYGLGANPYNEEALEKIFLIKERDRGKPVSILIQSTHELNKWVTEISPQAQKLISKFWPGPLTLVFKAKPSVSSILTAGTGTLALRVSSHPVALALCKAHGAITTTSANLAGVASCSTSKEVDEQIGGRIEGIVGSETLPPSRGSTILDVTANDVKLLRAGDIPWEDIQKIIHEASL